MSTPYSLDRARDRARRRADVVVEARDDVVGDYDLALPPAFAQRRVIDQRAPSIRERATG